MSSHPASKLLLHDQMLIEERFDPDKFNSIFARGGSGAPSWLNGLLMDAGEE